MTFPDDAAEVVETDAEAADRYQRERARGYSESIAEAVMSGRGWFPGRAIGSYTGPLGEQTMKHKKRPGKKRPTTKKPVRPVTARLYVDHQGRCRMSYQATLPATIQSAGYGCCASPLAATALTG